MDQVTLFKADHHKLALGLHCLYIPYLFLILNIHTVTLETMKHKTERKSFWQVKINIRQLKRSKNKDLHVRRQSAGSEDSGALRQVSPLLSSEGLAKHSPFLGLIFPHVLNTRLEKCDFHVLQVMDVHDPHNKLGKPEMISAVQTDTKTKHLSINDYDPCFELKVKPSANLWLW